MKERRIEAAEHIVYYCGNLLKNESILFIYDATTKDVLPYLEVCAQKITNKIIKVEIPIMQYHGQEPSEEVALLMKDKDLIIAITKMSLAHTQARLNSCKYGSRYLSLAEYSCDILENQAILGVDRSKENKLVKLENLFTNGNQVTISSALGTNLQLDITNRVANNCPGYVTKPGDLGSPPDMEVNVSPIETSSNGLIVVDGSITHSKLGLLKKPVELEIINGSIVSFSNNIEGSIVKNIMHEFNDEKVFVLAELGVGFNTKAKINGTMLIDEGAADCIHFGFRSNSTVGGKNEVSFHLDFVMKNANLYLDNALIIKKGSLLI